MKKNIQYGISVLFLLLLVLFFSSDVVDQPEEIASHLHPSLPHNDHLSMLDKARVKVVMHSIQNLEEHLGVEAKALRELERQRAEKAGSAWFPDVSTQREIGQLELQVNDQKRKIAHGLEEIGLQWNELKPLYGVRSRMFVHDVFVSITSVLVDMFAFLIPSFELSLLTFATLGPMAFTLLATYAHIGLVALPLIVAIFCTTWAVRFPRLLLQYGPTPGELVFSYLLACGLMMSLISLLYFIFTEPVIVVQPRTTAKIRID